LTDEETAAKAMDKERKPADDLLVLAICILIGAAKRPLAPQKNGMPVYRFQFIYQAIMVGEFGLQYSFHNYHILLLLIRLYAHRI
jgi:hypothetical protein